MTPDKSASLPYRRCVGVMLANPAGEVFVGQRIDTGTAAWQMPQGGIDKGETVAEAGLRELWEETGVTADLVRIEAETAGWLRYDLPPDLLGNVWKGKYCGQEQKWLLARYLGTDAQIRIATEHPEFSAWRWIPPAELAEAVVAFKREVYRAVLAEFGDRL